VPRLPEKFGPHASSLSIRAGTAQADLGKTAHVRIRGGGRLRRGRSTVLGPTSRTCMV